MMMESMLFDRNNARYRCCSECCHVRIGAMLIGIIELCLVMYEFISKLVLVVSTAQLGDYYAPYYTVLWLNMFSMMLFLLCIVFLFLGIIKTVPYLLLPLLVAQVICIVGILLMLILAFAPSPARQYYWFYVSGNSTFAELPVNSSTPRPIEGDARVPSYMVGSIVFYVVQLLILVFFTHIILKCYRYLKEKYLHERLIGIPLQR